MSSSPLRLLFAGTPDFAATFLKALIESEHQLTAVYTQPDRCAGRGKQLQASPVKQLAQEAAIPVCQPATLKPVHEQQALAQWRADAMVVVAYGLLLPAPVLQAPRFGCVNVHASLLPRWRGAAPIQRAIEAGDTETGITIMRMDEGLDTGDMLALARCPIDAEATAHDLHRRLAALGVPALLGVLADLPGRLAQARPQDDAQATYARKIDKAEAELDWRLDAPLLARRVRAFNPSPVCFSTLAGERIRIWQAHAAPAPALSPSPGTIVQADHTGVLVDCGRGQLCITQLQLPGGRTLGAQQVLHARGKLFAAGNRFDLPRAATSA